jgi:hypothetical protein
LCSSHFVLPFSADLSRLGLTSTQFHSAGAYSSNKMRGQDQDLPVLLVLPDNEPSNHLQVEADQAASSQNSSSRKRHLAFGLAGLVLLGLATWGVANERVWWLDGLAAVGGSSSSPELSHHVASFAFSPALRQGGSRSSPMASSALRTAPRSNAQMHGAGPMLATAPGALQDEAAAKAAWLARQDATYGGYEIGSNAQEGQSLRTRDNSFVVHGEERWRNGKGTEMGLKGHTHGHHDEALLAEWHARHQEDKAAWKAKWNGASNGVWQ